VSGDGEPGLDGHGVAGGVVVVGDRAGVVVGEPDHDLPVVLGGAARGRGSEEVIGDVRNDGARAGLAPGPRRLNGADVAQLDVDALGKLDVGERLDAAAAGPGPLALPGDGVIAEAGEVGAVGARRVRDAPLVEVEGVRAGGDGVPLAAVGRRVDQRGAWGGGGQGECGAEKGEENECKGGHGERLASERAKTKRAASRGGAAVF